MKASTNFIVGSVPINIKKRLFASSFLSVCPHVSVLFTRDGISRHVHIRDFY